MADVAVIIVAEKDADLNRVRALSEDHGLKQVRMLVSLRTIWGYIDPSNLVALRSVPGIRSVELERQVGLRSSGSSSR